MRRSFRAALATALAVPLVAGVGFAMSRADATPSVVRLHLGTDSKSFSYGTTTQNLTTTSTTCVINSSETVMHLGASPTGAVPGLVGDGIGVKKTTSSNGTPCAQIDGAEALTLSPTGAIAGRLFTGVRLDLEVTGNVSVLVTLTGPTRSQLYQLQSGNAVASSQRNEADYDRYVPYLVSSGPGDTTDACAAQHSSGPNSNANDNCEWSINPGFSFNQVKIAVSSCGAVALEGSRDFGNDPNYDTLFYLANSAPAPTNDTIVTDEDTAATGNVLANDTDPDGNPLSATVVTPPAHGALNLAANGAYTYTPALDYHGPDSFVYAASDGALSTNATASITVNSVNDPPVAQSESITTDEDAPITFTVATDVDSSSITSDCTSDAGGSFADHGDGTVTFTPPQNFHGTANVECTATDDQGAGSTSSAIVTIGVAPVNDAPVAVDDSADIPQDVATSVDVIENDTDVDLDPLLPTAIADIAPADSTAVVEADGSVTFTPPAGYTGPASFTYAASDGTASSANRATVSLTVYPTICTNETVADTDAAVNGAFTRLTDSFECKRYTLEAISTADTVLFQPSGTANVDYRGYVSFGPDPRPSGPFSLLLRYDPTGGTTYQPVQWCIAPSFDGSGNVTTATIPVGESWCIAGANTVPDVNGDLVVTWQVFGHDDPKFTR